MHGYEMPLAVHFVIEIKGLRVCLKLGFLGGKLENRINYSFFHGKIQI